MNEFIEHFGPSLVSVLFGYLIMSVIGYFVIKSELAAIKGILGDHKQSIRDHAENFKRVTWRDECERSRASCSRHGDERYAEVIKRLDRLESSFKSCMDDLVEALKDKEG